ncbi:5-oxoprolinase subunit PxpB [Shewanella loihica]|uniref:Allophanate hydrolase subunit 1 n=1 Tax=Shewanella loihica (strain ATCC BAA-1088 / PV-4) TaxID=323850 RepID=A3Q8T3_SHELP|nr:5-oxoprolinase subunit PxpB [Shewanella loihica]ABO21881.1 Allophanate hydrolase subunit 1 [Shewanella loihica PV-4]
MMRDSHRFIPSLQINIYPLGERALVLDPSPEATLSWAVQSKLCWIAEQLRQFPIVEEAIPGMNNLTIVVRETRQLKAMQARLAELWQSAPAETRESRTIEIPVSYGGDAGPDLLSVAQFHHLSPEEVVKLHSQACYQVFFIGFQPGFAYLEGLPKHLHTPRLATPRLTIPAGSVGIGGEQTGIYPLTSPSGWQIIGQTQLALFDPTSDTLCLLKPGDRVRFIPVEIAL